MPELPEVETIRRSLDKAVSGRRFNLVNVARRDLRRRVPETFAAVLEGKKVLSTLRRGKYILVFLESGAGFVLHLGMSGRIRIYRPFEKYESQKHDHIVFGLDDDSQIVFNDPRRFGMAYLTSESAWTQEPPFMNMGPEPLDENFTGAVLAQKLKGRSANIKAALLDQKIVAGVGNIYACEALFHAGIHPSRSAGSLKNKETEKLAQAIKTVLQKAIAAGGSTLRDYRHTDGSLGYFQHSFSVYDREGVPCENCTCREEKKPQNILRMIQSGRSTFYCPYKQV